VRTVIEGLEKSGFIVLRQPTVNYSYPPLSLESPFELLIRGIRIGGWHTENDYVSQEFVRGLDSNVDYNLCSSKHILEVFKGSGVPENKLVSCHLSSVDTNIFYPIEQKREGPFRFLWVGAHQPRKGVDILIKAFGMAFSSKDDVELIIKNGSYGWKENIDYMISNHHLKDKIQHISDDISQQSLADLYRSASFGRGAFIHSHRAEGFGRTILEAAICGCRVGMTGWGGPMDYVEYLNESECFPYTLQTSQFHNHPGEPYYDVNEPQPQWAEANIEAVVNWMKQIVTGSYSQEGLNLQSRQLSRNYSSEAISLEIANTISRLI
jgi:glycosyltransferase involved in cell wall biosynthesis